MTSKPTDAERQRKAMRLIVRLPVQIVLAVFLMIALGIRTLVLRIVKGPVPKEWLEERQRVLVAAECPPPGSWKRWWYKTPRPGDEIWSWSSPPETWEKLYGRAGWARLRNGRVLAKGTTLMN